MKPGRLLNKEKAAKKAVDKATSDMEAGVYTKLDEDAERILW